MECELRGVRLKFIWIGCSGRYSGWYQLNLPNKQSTLHWYQPLSWLNSSRWDFGRFTLVGACSLHCGIAICLHLDDWMFRLPMVVIVSVSTFVWIVDRCWQIVCSKMAGFWVTVFRIGDTWQNFDVCCHKLLAIISLLHFCCWKYNKSRHKRMFCPNSSEWLRDFYASLPR